MDNFRRIRHSNFKLQFVTLLDVVGIRIRTGHGGGGLSGVPQAVRILAVLGSPSGYISPLSAGQRKSWRPAHLLSSQIQSATGTVTSYSKHVQVVTQWVQNIGYGVFVNLPRESIKMYRTGAFSLTKEVRMRSCAERLHSYKCAPTYSSRFDLVTIWSI